METVLGSSVSQHPDKAPPRHALQVPLLCRNGNHEGRRYPKSTGIFVVSCTSTKQSQGNKLKGLYGKRRLPSSPENKLN